MSNDPSLSLTLNSAPIAASPAVSGSAQGKGMLLFGATLGTFMGVTSMIAIPLGVMLVPIADAFGWSRTAVAGAFTALSLSQAVAYPIAGRIADRFGTRRTLLIGFIGVALTLLAVAAAPPVPFVFYALFVVAGVVGVLGSTMVVAKLVAQWFQERRGFWLGLVGGAGNGLGGMVMPALTGIMVVNFGWRQSFAMIGGFILLVGLPIVFATLRSPPSDAASEDMADVPGMSFLEVMRSPLFWAVFTAVPIGGGALTGVFANAVTILDSQGLSVTLATIAVTLFALICVIVEPLVGHMLDSAARPRRVVGYYVLAVVGLVVLAHAHTPLWAVIGCLLTGLGLGAEFSVLPYLLARYFGLREMGTISGVAYAGALASNGISPLILNASFDRLGSYAPGVYVVAAMMVYALVVFYLLPAFPEEERAAS